jgi:hypothetical protein
MELSPSFANPFLEDEQLRFRHDGEWSQRDFSAFGRSADILVCGF